MDKLTVRDVDVAGKRVFVRVDFNVPLADGKVTDDSRIRAALPTISALLAGGRARHPREPPRPARRQGPGRPRLRPVGQRLSELLAATCRSPAMRSGSARRTPSSGSGPGEVLLLENLRFHAEEEANDPAFAEALASYADVYVNDAFGTAHRAHASTVGIAKLLPAYAGLLMEREIEMLSKLLETPERPFAAILGGAKVSDKIKVLDHLLTKVDMLVLGGGMANTFLLAQGKAVGKSLAEPDRVDDARRILATAAKNGVRVVLPTDVIVAKEVTRGTEYKTLQAEKIPASWHIVDLGKASQDLIVEALRRRPDRLLERAAGRLRDPVVRARHERDRADAGRPGRRRRDGRRRRRRLGRGGQPAGPGRPDDPHLDRRRRVARIPRGPRAARRRRPARPPGDGEGRHEGEGTAHEHRHRSRRRARDPRLARQSDGRGRRHAGRRRRSGARPCRPARRPAPTRRSSCATATRRASAARACSTAVANVIETIAPALYRPRRRRTRPASTRC